VKRSLGLCMKHGNTPVGLSSKLEDSTLWPERARYNARDYCPERYIVHSKALPTHLQAIATNSRRLANGSHSSGDSFLRLRDILGRALVAGALIFLLDRQQSQLEHWRVA